MRKLKLLLLLLTLICGSNVMWAQTDVFKDVTDDYLTNADFEGEYEEYSRPRNDGNNARAIYKPKGWTVTYTSGNENDMSCLNSNCLQWSQFSGKAQLGNGGNNTYWIRMNWGSGQTLELSQNVTLPLGKYTLTAAYYKDGLGGESYIFANETTNTASGNANQWKEVSVEFNSNGSATTTIGGRLIHNSQNTSSPKIVGYDNFVLQWNLTQSLQMLITAATEVYNEDKSNTQLGNAIQAATEKLSSTDADELETAYNNLQAVAALALNRKAWKEAKEAAEAAVASNDYANVTGSEKTNLQALIEAEEPTTAEGYNQATQDLTEATATFTGAKAAYDELATAKAQNIPVLTYASEAATTALTNAKNANAANAADVPTKINAITNAIRAYYESHALAEGVDGAVNVTSSLANPDAMDANNGWTWTGSKNDPKNNEPWTDASGNSSHWYFDGGNWGDTSWTTTMKQSIALPAGTYLLTAKGRAATNTTLTMAVGESNVELPHVGNAGNVFNRGWGDASLEFTTDGKGAEIVVTATSSTIHEWFSIADFRLMQLSINESLYANDAADYAALNAAIEAKDGEHTLGFEADEYAPYNNIVVKEALAAAKAIDQTAVNTNLKTDVEALAAALNEATWNANVGEVNAVYDGDFALQPAHESGDNVVLPGWTTVSGNTRLILKSVENYPAVADADANAALFVHPGEYTYGNPTGYTMPLKANTLYQVTAKYCAWQNGSNNNFTITVKDANGTNVAEKSYGKVQKGLNEAEALKEVTLYFKTTEAGNYKLTIGANGNTAFTDVKLVKAVAENITLNEGDEYTPVETYANVTLTRSFNENWATFVVPFDIDNATLKAQFGNNVEVLEVNASNEEGADIEFVAADHITANVPVMIKVANTEGTYTFEGVLIKEGTPTKNIASGVYFEGNYAGDIAIPSEDGYTYYYVARNQLLLRDAQQRIKGFRAYFKVANASPAKSFFESFSFGDATGINSLTPTLSEGEGAIFDLQGRRVQNPQRGIYIVNGKKVVVK